MLSIYSLNRRGSIFRCKSEFLRSLITYHCCPAGFSPKSLLFSSYSINFSMGKRSVISFPAPCFLRPGLSPVSGLFHVIEHLFFSLRTAHLFDFFKGVFQDIRIFEKTIAKYYEKQLNNIGVTIQNPIRKNVLSAPSFCSCGYLAT